MGFLKTLFWVLIAVAIALFSAQNWTPVTVNLWGTLVMDTVLPVVIIASFLLGVVPMLLLHRATRWNLGRKLQSAERSISELTSSSAAAAVPSPAPTGTIPPAAAPIAVPPGVS